MRNIAYLANQFPSPMEPYVCDEILELRQRGFTVVPCSARAASTDLAEDSQKALAAETLYLEPLRLKPALQAVWLCVRQAQHLTPLLRRTLLQGKEPMGRRARALLHTWLGACLALRLKGLGVQHIHVHHGYFASWVGMVAARLRGTGFSVTLHGSDLLVHRAYLDTKLQHCGFCLTVSEFNRDQILKRYPEIAAHKVIVQRMGVDVALTHLAQTAPVTATRRLTLLAVGRLHRIKDHAFLVQACKELKNRGLKFRCDIAGEGPERLSLERLIGSLGLTNEVELLGHLSCSQLEARYAASDVVALTSRSEGIPLVLMEAMAREKVVLAPAITGIPELVVDGETGFLYRPGSVADFVARLEEIWRLRLALGPMRHAARERVIECFNREKNLSALADLFFERIPDASEPDNHANPLLQQVQLPV